MDLKELEHIFRFQTTETETYIPKDTVDYLLINGQNRVPGTHAVNDMEGLLKQITENGYVFDAYRDRTPVFIVPEVILPM